MESKINLSQVKPVNYRITASLVNQFIVSTTQFLNRFGTRCDLKLRQVEHNMHRITTTLNILEAKLSSLPTSDSKPASSATAPAGTPASESLQPHPTDSHEQPQAPPQAPSAQPPAPQQAAAATPEAAQVAPAQEPPVQGPKLKDDPRYSTYFKMLRMGVPAPAVKVKMNAEGADPSMLDQDPEGPAPPGAPPPPASSNGSDDDDDDDDSEFSD